MHVLSWLQRVWHCYALELPSDDAVMEVGRLPGRGEHCCPETRNGAFGLPQY